MDVHQLCDALTALAHGKALEQLAQLVEQQNGHALLVVPHAHSAYGGDGHEEVLIKDLPVDDAMEGT